MDMLPPLLLLVTVTAMLPPLLLLVLDTAMLPPLLDTDTELPTLAILSPAIDFAQFYPFSAVPNTDVKYKK